MPEYLAPGVYVEETSFRSKSLEGVSTSTAGFVGPTRYGPTSGDPELVTSFLDFQRIYGGLDDLRFGDGAGGLLPAQRNYLAHAVRAFFEEGGKRLFITRAFGFADDFAVNNDGVPSAHYGFADTSAIAAAAPQIGVRARFPGEAGNLRVTFTARVAANALITTGATPTLSRVQEYDVVFAHVGAAAVRGDGLFTVRWDRVNRRWALRGNGAELLLNDAVAGQRPDSPGHHSRRRGAARRRQSHRLWQRADAGRVRLRRARQPRHHRHLHPPAVDALPLPHRALCAGVAGRL